MAIQSTPVIKQEYRMSHSTNFTIKLLNKMDSRNMNYVVFLLSGTKRGVKAFQNCLNTKFHALQKGRNDFHAREIVVENFQFIC